MRSLFRVQNQIIRRRLRRRWEHLNRRRFNYPWRWSYQDNLDRLALIRFGFAILDLFELRMFVFRQFACSLITKLWRNFLHAGSETRLADALANTMAVAVH